MIYVITFNNERVIHFCDKNLFCVTNHVHYRSDFGGTKLRKIWNKSIKDSLNSIGNQQLRWWHIMNMSYFPNYISSWAGRWEEGEGGGHSSGINKPFNLAFLGHRCALRDSSGGGLCSSHIHHHSENVCVCLCAYLSICGLKCAKHLMIDINVWEYYSMFARWSFFPHR